VEVPTDARRRVLDRPAEKILRPAARWVLPIAEHAVALYEARLPTDARPRTALEAAQRFALGGRRGQELRTTGWAAHKASSHSPDLALKSAARAASLTAAVAYMHLDLIDANQLKHLYGPVVYTAQALELAADGSSEIGDQVIVDALSSATDSVTTLARSMPALPPAKTCLSHLYAALDAGLREGRGTDTTVTAEAASNEASSCSCGAE